MIKSKNEMLKIIDALQNKDSKKNILVLGDSIFDSYAIGNIYRMSPEAPVPILSITKTEWRLGGAANVFNNIVHLGGNAHICTMLGNDNEGYLIKNKLSNLNKDTDFVFVAEKRKTSKKTRFLTEDQKHLLRSDDEETYPMEENDAAEQIISKIKNRINEFEILVISDYAKGFVTEFLTKQVINIFRDNNKIVLTDPKSKDISKYRGSYLIKPNQNEFINFIGSRKSKMKMSFITKQGEKLLDKSGAEYIYVTIGKKGGILIGKHTASMYIQARSKKAIDITGAGDAVIASIALALSAGINMADAVVFSSYVAGVCVGKIGTEQMDWNDIRQLAEFE